MNTTVSNKGAGQVGERKGEKIQGRDRQSETVISEIAESLLEAEEGRLQNQLVTLGRDAGLCSIGKAACYHWHHLTAPSGKWSSRAGWALSGDGAAGKHVNLH